MSRFLTITTLRLGRLAGRVGQWQGALQVAAGIIAFGLGFWGWTIKTPPADAQDWLNNLFKTFQLITLNFPSSFDGSLPWQLQVGRLALPVVAVVASLNIIVGSLTRPARLALLQHNRDHVIFFGPPKLTDDALAWLADQGYQLVIVFPGVSSARLQVMEGLGLTVVDADPLRPGLLDNLNVKDARGLFVATGDDIANANVSALVLRRMAGRVPGSDPMVLAAEFRREDLAAALVHAVDGLARDQAVRFYRLSTDREALALELERAAPRLQPAAGRDAPVHAVVVGLGGDWEQVVRRLVVGLQMTPDAAPILTVCLDGADIERFERWRAARPELALVADIRLLHGARPDAASAAGWAAWRDQTPAPELVLVLQDDADGLATALALRAPDSPLRAGQAVILVHQSREDRILGALAELRMEAADAPAVRPFGGVLREASVKRLFDRAGEALAIALHARYVAVADTLGGASPKALAAWEQLPENLRDANRSAAAHAPVLLRAIGCDPQRFGAAELAAISADGWERLARIEHRHWCADRIDHGWRFGPVRDDAARLHPSLVPWSGLSEPERQKDRNAVTVLLATLAQQPAGPLRPGP